MMPGPTLLPDSWSEEDFISIGMKAALLQIERHRLAQLVADRHARRFSSGMNTCETSQCQCKEIARLLNNNFQKGTA